MSKYFNHVKIKVFCRLNFFSSEFFFESEFRDEDAKKSDVPSRNDERKDALRNVEKSIVAKGRSKPKTNKRDSTENKPLLGKSDDLLGDEGLDDLLGLDLSRSDDTDALLLELASLDFGQSQPIVKELSDGILADSDPILQQESFLANFDQVFGSAKQTSDTDWNLLLPSHFLATNFVRDDSSLLLSNDHNTLSSSTLPPKASKESNDDNKKNETVEKKVIPTCL